MIRTPYRTPRKVIRYSVGQLSSNVTPSIALKDSNHNTSTREHRHDINLGEYQYHYGTMSPQPKVLSNQPRTLNYYVIQQKRTILIYIVALFVIVTITTATTTPTSTIQKIAYVTAFAIPITIKRSFEIIVTATTSPNNKRRDAQTSSRSSGRSSSSSVLQLSPYEEYMNSRRNVEAEQQVQVQPQQLSMGYQQQQLHSSYASIPTTTYETTYQNSYTNKNYNNNEASMHHTHSSYQNNNNNMMFQEVRYNADPLPTSTGYTSPTTTTTPATTPSVIAWTNCNNNWNSGYNTNKETTATATTTECTNSHLNNNNFNSEHHPSSPNHSTSTTIPTATPSVVWNSQNWNTAYNTNTDAATTSGTYNQNNNNNENMKVQEEQYNAVPKSSLDSYTSTTTATPSMGWSTNNWNSAYNSNKDASTAVATTDSTYNYQNNNVNENPIVQEVPYNSDPQPSPNGYASTTSAATPSGTDLNSNHFRNTYHTNTDAVTSIAMSKTSNAQYESQHTSIDNNDNLMEQHQPLSPSPDLHQHPKAVISSSDSSNAGISYSGSEYSPIQQQVAEQATSSSFTTSTWSTTETNRVVAPSHNNINTTPQSTTVDTATVDPISKSYTSLSSWSAGSDANDKQQSSLSNNFESHQTFWSPTSTSSDQRQQQQQQYISTGSLTSFPSTKYSTSPAASGTIFAQEAANDFSGNQCDSLPKIGGVTLSPATTTSTDLQSASSLQFPSCDHGSSNNSIQNQQFLDIVSSTKSTQSVTTSPVASSIEKSGIDHANFADTSSLPVTEESTQQVGAAKDEDYIPQPTTLTLGERVNINDPTKQTQNHQRQIEDENTSLHASADPMMSSPLPIPIETTSMQEEESIHARIRNDRHDFHEQPAEAAASSPPVVSTTSLFSTALASGDETLDTSVSSISLADDVISVSSEVKRNESLRFGKPSALSPESSIDRATDYYLDKKDKINFGNLKESNKDKRKPLGLFGTNLMPTRYRQESLTNVVKEQTARFGQSEIASIQNSQSISTIAETSVRSLVDTTGMTERIMNQIDESNPLMKKRNSDTYAAFKQLENDWNKVKQRSFAKFSCGDTRKSSEPKMLSLPFVTSDAVLGNPKCWAKLREHATHNKLDYDIVVCGSTYGMFLALALILRNPQHRVCVVESASAARCPDKEWFVSPIELNELVKMNILTEDDVKSITLTKFPAGRFGFQDNEVSRLKGELFESIVGMDCPADTILGVSPNLSLERVTELFVKSGGVILNGASINGVTISDTVGAALDLGEAHEPITTQLLIDCLGNNSQISTRQDATIGLKPDGCCIVVGTHAHGYDDHFRGQSDIVVSADTTQDTFSDGILQYFCEAPSIEHVPSTTIKQESTAKTIYMFTYLNADQDRPSLESIMDDYWRMLPKYQPSVKNPEHDLEIQQVFCSYFPTYRNNFPALTQYNRILSLCDSDGNKSPLSFTSLGTVCRNLSWLTQAINEIFQRGDFQKGYLDEVFSYAPSLSSAWMFQKAMQTKLEQIEDTTFVNRILSVSSKTRLRAKELSSKKLTFEAPTYDSQSIGQSMRFGFANYISKLQSVSAKVDSFDQKCNFTAMPQNLIDMNSVDPIDELNKTPLNTTVDKSMDFNKGSHPNNEETTHNNDYTLDSSTCMTEPKLTSENGLDKNDAPKGNNILHDNKSLIPDFQNETLPFKYKENVVYEKEETNADKSMEIAQTNQQKLFGSLFEPETTGQELLASVPQINDDVHIDNLQSKMFGSSDRSMNIDHHMSGNVDVDNESPSEIHESSSISIENLKSYAEVKCTLTKEDEGEAQISIEPIPEMPLQNNIHEGANISPTVKAERTLLNDEKANAVTHNSFDENNLLRNKQPIPDGVVYEGKDFGREISQSKLRSTDLSYVASSCNIDSGSKKSQDRHFTVSSNSEKEIIGNHIPSNSFSTTTEVQQGNPFAHQAMEGQRNEQIRMDCESREIRSKGNSISTEHINDNSVYKNIHHHDQIYSETPNVEDMFSSNQNQGHAMNPSPTGFGIDQSHFVRSEHSPESTTMRKTFISHEDSYHSTTGNKDPVGPVVQDYNKLHVMPSGSSYENIHAHNGHQHASSGGTKFQTDEDSYFSTTTAFEAISKVPVNPALQDYNKLHVMSSGSSYDNVHAYNGNQHQSLGGTNVQTRIDRISDNVAVDRSQHLGGGTSNQVSSHLSKSILPPNDYQPLNESHPRNVLQTLQGGITYESVREYQSHPQPQQQQQQQQHHHQQHHQQQYTSASSSDHHTGSDTNPEFIAVKRTPYQRYNTNNDISATAVNAKSPHNGYSTSVLEPPTIPNVRATTHRDELNQHHQIHNQQQEVSQQVQAPHQTYDNALLERFSDKVDRHSIPQHLQHEQHSRTPPSPSPHPDDGFDRFRLVARGTSVPIKPDKGMEHKWR